MATARPGCAANEDFSWLLYCNFTAPHHQTGAATVAMGKSQEQKPSPAQQRQPIYQLPHDVVEGFLPWRLEDSKHSKAKSS